MLAKKLIKDVLNLDFYESSVNKKAFHFVFHMWSNDNLNFCVGKSATLAPLLMPRLNASTFSFGSNRNLLIYHAKITAIMEILEFLSHHRYAKVQTFFVNPLMSNHRFHIPCEDHKIGYLGHQTVLQSNKKHVS